jgi:hypothetical protein
MAFPLTYSISVGLQVEKTSTASEQKTNYLHQRLSQTLESGLSQNINIILEPQSSWTLDFSYLSQPKGIFLKASGAVGVSLNQTSEIDLVDFLLVSYSADPEGDNPLTEVEVSHPGALGSDPIQVELIVFGSAS